MDPIQMRNAVDEMKRDYARQTEGRPGLTRENPNVWALKEALEEFLNLVEVSYHAEDVPAV